MSEQGPSITCPECGTLNRPGSMFCAECGSMLPHPDSDSGATASFTPIRSVDDRTGDPWEGDDTGTTQIFTPRLETDDTGSGTGSVPPWPTPAGPAAPYIPDPGRRGFVLGIVATILILLVFGFFLWSTVASDSFRDSITGLF